MALFIDMKACFTCEYWAPNNNWMWTVLIFIKCWKT